MYNLNPTRTAPDREDWGDMENSHWQKLQIVFLMSLLTTLLGCGTLPNGRGWGQDATLFPGWGKIGKAAVNAALSPATWAPAAGALIFQIDDWDGKVSDWASKRNPLFGSQRTAYNTSDYLLFSSGVAYGVTAALTPSGEEPGAWTLAKLKGVSVGLAAIGITEGITVGLQDGVRRSRPNGQDSLSFTSTHVSRSSVCFTLASRNVEFISMPEQARLACQIGFGILTVGTAWSRVEAKMHYPSDVLVSMALGHFIGAFVNDAFIGADPQSFNVSLNTSRNGTMLAMYWAF